MNGGGSEHTHSTLIGIFGAHECILFLIWRRLDFCSQCVLFENFPLCTFYCLDSMSSSVWMKALNSQHIKNSIRTSYYVYKINFEYN